MTGADQLCALMALTVTEVVCGDDASLRVEFEDGAVLTISGQPNSGTVGDVWWLGSA